MVAFDEYYRIDPAEIAYIRAGESDNKKYPYRLTVRLKSGPDLTVDYGSKASRDKARNQIAAKVWEEQHEDADVILNRLTRMEYTLDLLNKRQLRIWRILSRLPPVKADIDKEG